MNNINVINDQVLTRICEGYEPDGFIGDMLLPKIQVATRSGDLKQLGKEHLRIVPDIAGAATQTKAIDYSLTKASRWYVEDHRLKMLVTKADAEQLGGMAKAKVSAAKRLKVAMKTQKEYALASSVTSTTVMTKNRAISGTDRWNDYDNSDPLADFAEARASIQALHGRLPNVAVMNWPVYNTLIYHPDILDKLGFKYNRAGQLSTAELAKVMEVDKILVGTAKYNSAAAGQTAVLSDIWGKDCLFAYVNPNPQPEVYEESLGYEFWMNNLWKADSYKESDPPDAEYVRVESDFDLVVLANGETGYLYKTVID